jgi:CO dehydrogenase/acetyl-CoA synthase beta subunit
MRGHSQCWSVASQEEEEKEEEEEEDEEEEKRKKKKTVSCRCLFFVSSLYTSVDYQRSGIRHTTPSAKSR